MERSFSVEKNGVRVTVSFDHMPLVAGDVNWATTRVTNVGTDDLVWTHDGCSISVAIYGEITGTTFRWGDDPAGNLRTFKEMALEFIDNGRVWVGFVPEKLVGRGGFRCADLALRDTIKPNGSIRQRMAGTGASMASSACHPAARRDSPEPSSTTRAPAWVPTSRGSLGSSTSRSTHGSPAAAIPAASIRARSWTQPWRTPRSRPGTGRWWVGFLFYESDSFHIARVDGVTGRVIDVIGRPWNPTATPRRTSGALRK